ncbi:cupin domain-containing protein [Pelagibacterium sp.]|uniref:cupin domain-containing protein n=1 Tax=Pelagibacterium sp. TaxID=1967288 RepID=UPI003BAB1EB4
MAQAGAVERLVLDDDGRFPNSALGVLVYRAAIEEGASAEAFKTLFSRNGWPAQWVGSIFGYHHYHSTAHEVLGVASGNARIALGGPQGRVVEVRDGDAVVIPAGVAHKLESSSADFAVVGAYPPGQDWDILTGEKGERETALANISNVPLPQTDPVQGEIGTLPGAWSEG